MDVKAGPEGALCVLVVLEQVVSGFSKSAEVDFEVEFGVCWLNLWNVGFRPVYCSVLLIKEHCLTSDRWLCRTDTTTYRKTMGSQGSFTNELDVST